jgi:hypothetical protein
MAYQAAQIKGIFELTDPCFVQNVELLTFSIPVAAPAYAEASQEQVPTMVTESLSCGEHKLPVLSKILVDEHADYLGFGESMVRLSNEIALQILNLASLLFIDIVHKCATSSD